MAAASPYLTLLRFVDTRPAGPEFPDMLQIATSRPDRLDELGLPDCRATERIEAIDLRDALVPVVLGTIDDRTAIATVNRLCREYAVIPQLDVGRRLRFVTLRPGRVGALAQTVLPEALDLVASGDRARVAICAADDCAAPFVTRPAPRPREFCSPRCSGRVRVRRHRAARGPE